MASAGILEEMFNGIGFEYLYFNQDSNYAFGFEIFDVTKRDYEMRFGSLEYENVTGFVNFFFRKNFFSLWCMIDIEVIFFFCRNFCRNSTQNILLQTA